MLRHNQTKIDVANYPYQLEWNDFLGYGYLESVSCEYGREYWDKYQSYRNAMGTKLNLARLKFVTDRVDINADLCDVGIGSGEFVTLADCKGYDINECACDWLRKRKKFANPYQEKFNTLTLWDVIEHIATLSPLFEQINHLFLSTPIYADLTACLQSKHFKPGEHLWYFTDTGIKNFMKFHSFNLHDESQFETDLGREGIKSYHFVKFKAFS